MSLALGRAMHDWPELKCAIGFYRSGNPLRLPSCLWRFDTDRDPALSLVTFLHMALGEQAPELAIRARKVLVLITAPPLVILFRMCSRP